MDLNFTQEYEDFRTDVRGFLDAHKADAPAARDRSVRVKNAWSGKKSCWPMAMQVALCPRNMAAMAPRPMR